MVKCRASNAVERIGAVLDHNVDSAHIVSCGKWLQDLRIHPENTVTEVPADVVMFEIRDTGAPFINSLRKRVIYVVIEVSPFVVSRSRDRIDLDEVSAASVQHEAVFGHDFVEKAVVCVIAARCGNLFDGVQFSVRQKIVWVILPSAINVDISLCFHADVVQNIFVVQSLLLDSEKRISFFELFCVNVACF